MTEISRRLFMKGTVLGATVASVPAVTVALASPDEVSAVVSGAPMMAESTGGSGGSGPLPAYPEFALFKRTPAGWREVGTLAEVQLPRKLDGHLVLTVEPVGQWTWWS